MSEKSSRVWLLILVTAIAAASGLCVRSMGSIRYWLVLRSSSIDAFHVGGILVVTALAPVAAAILGRKLISSRPIVVLLTATAGGLFAAATFLPAVGIVWGLIVGLVVCYAQLNRRSLLVAAFRVAAASVVGAVGVSVARRVSIDVGVWWWSAWLIFAFTLAAQFAILAAPFPQGLAGRQRERSQRSLLANFLFSAVVLIAFPLTWLAGWHLELNRRIAAIEAGGGSVAFTNSHSTLALHALRELRPDLLEGRRSQLLHEIVWGPWASKVVLDQPEPRHLRTAGILNGSPEISLTESLLEDATLAQLPLRVQMSTIRSTREAGSRLRSRGRYAESAAAFERALEAQRRLLIAGHPDTCYTILDLGRVYLLLDRREVAASHLEQFVQHARKSTLASLVPSALLMLGEIRIDEQKFAAAEPLYRECVAKIQPGTWNSFDARSLLGASLAGQGNYAEAEPFLIEGYEGMAARDEQTLTSARRATVARATKQIVLLYEDWNRPELAAKWQTTLQRHQNSLVEVSGEPE